MLGKPPTVLPTSSLPGIGRETMSGSTLFQREWSGVASSVVSRSSSGQVTDRAGDKSSLSLLNTAGCPSLALVRASICSGRSSPDCVPPVTNRGWIQFSSNDRLLRLPFGPEPLAGASVLTLRAPGPPLRGPVPAVLLREAYCLPFLLSSPGFPVPHTHPRRLTSCESTGRRSGRALLGSTLADRVPDVNPGLRYPCPISQWALISSGQPSTIDGLSCRPWGRMLGYRRQALAGPNVSLRIPELVR